MLILSSPEYESKYDDKHLLLLNKIYNFGPGIIHLCEKMKLREELLDYYMGKGDHDNIINFCKKQGLNDMNLWVQALSYFVAPTDDSTESARLARVPQILSYVKDVEALSPLLVLDICSKEKNVSFSYVKDYFKKKIEANEVDIKKCENIFMDNYEFSQKSRQEHKKLLSQGRVYQNQRCDDERCASRLGNEEAIIYFLCGHAYHQRCIPETGRDRHECMKCLDNNSNVLQMKEDLMFKEENLSEFMEKLGDSSNKFDVLCEFLGRGMFRIMEDDNI